MSDPCPLNKIYNPLTKRCVAIGLPAYQKLIKEYKEGKVQLSAANVSKINQQDPQVKSSTPSTKKNTLNMASKCKDDEIYNPATEKCVKLNGPSGKKLVKQHKDGSVNLPPVTKATKATIKTVHVTTQPSTVKGSQPNQPVHVPDRLKNRIHAFVEAWKKIHASKYVDENHQQYCSTKKMSLLKKPIVNMNVTIEFPISRMQSLYSGFVLDTLNYPKQKFNLEKFQGAQFVFNNYSFRNLLYKNKESDIIHFENMIDSDWIKQMNSYINNLSTKDLYTIVGYTFYGDTVANNYMRRNLNKIKFTNEMSSLDKWVTNYYPLFFQAIEYLDTVGDVFAIIKDGKDVSLEIKSNSFYNTNVAASHMFNKKMNLSTILREINNKSIKFSDKYIILFNIGRYLSFTKFWQEVIRLYIKDLNRIIHNSPSLTTPIFVYRGVKNDYYLKGKQGNVYKTNSFVSTSINLSSALRFAGHNCCFKRITLLPGTKALLIAGVSRYKQEIEILLPCDAQFYLTTQKRYVSKVTTEMCPLKTNEILVTDAVVIK